ncbi:MAG: EI24 domain-containing protein [Burkholderiales bacterium]
MQTITEALLRALRDLMQPRIIGLIVWPVLLALVLWGGLALFFRASLYGWLQHWLAGYGVSGTYFGISFGWLGDTLAVVLFFALLIPLINITALLITSTFAMPLLLRFVGERDYADLEIKRGGNTWGSVWNALIGVSIFCVLWIITLPLWLIPPLAVVLPILLSAYLNQKLFGYDALAEHASEPEYKTLVQQTRSNLWLLAILVAFIQFIPLANFIAPVFMGLAFIHYALTRLRLLRQAGGTGPFNRPDATPGKH